VGLAKRVLHEWWAATGKVAFIDLQQIPVRIERELRTVWGQVDLADGGFILRRLRRIKSPAEVVVLRELGRITSIGMTAALAAVRASATESDVAGAALGACATGGAERLSYGCLASAGPRSHMKNIYPRPDKPMREGELVVIDLGCQFKGYQSDVSRNAVAGTPPSDVRRLLDVYLEAQQVGLGLVKPGTPAMAVVEAMQQVVARNGFAEWDWTTCHGFGTDIAEERFFFPGSTVILEPGMTFYIEPMIIPTSIGTASIEDMLLVTDNGYEELTAITKRTGSLDRRPLAAAHVASGLSDA
jgi:Xaa-Pro aminopeptidase